MSYLPSYILLIDALNAFDYPAIVNCKDELQKLSREAQLDLFKTAFSIAAPDHIPMMLLIIDTYCPAIQKDLMRFAADTNNVALFTALYTEYNIVLTDTIAHCN